MMMKQTIHFVALSLVLLCFIISNSFGCQNLGDSKLISKNTYQIMWLSKRKKQMKTNQNTLKTEKSQRAIFWVKMPEKLFFRRQK
jgi:hypothetical protein